MTPSDKEQEPTPVSIPTPIPGDAPEENAGPLHSALGVNVQDMMLLAELVSSVTREMKGVLDTVERCLSEARVLAESEGIKLDEDIGLLPERNCRVLKVSGEAVRTYSGDRGRRIVPVAGPHGRGTAEGGCPDGRRTGDLGIAWFGGAAAVKPQAKGVTLVAACPVGGRLILAM